MTSKTGIFWFTNDLRLSDNPALLQASQACDELLLVYIIDEAWLQPNRFGMVSLGSHRWRFLCESLLALQTSLQTTLQPPSTQPQQQLIIRLGDPLRELAQLMTMANVHAVYRSVHAGYNEQQQWQELQGRFPSRQFISVHSHTLFTPNELPFSLEQLPSSFSKFRRIIEKTNPFDPDAYADSVSADDLSALDRGLAHTVHTLPPMPVSQAFNDYQSLALPTLAAKYPLTVATTSGHKHKQANSDTGKPRTHAELDPSSSDSISSTKHDQKLSSHLQAEALRWQGGCLTATQHCINYFASDAPRSYKQTRNSLDIAVDGWDYSSKLSAWLANGSVSPKQIVHYIRWYEHRFGANDSTYWLIFELLWREYFQWYSHHHGRRMFHFAGIHSQTNANRKPLTSFYAERWRKWVAGQTPYPIVNACMRQLHATGYMSNRGRQLVASCLVHELDTDWRYGAYYFEQQLVDYDVAANWGNWQYLAGVGADPRGHRKFDLDKQTQQYDPDGAFIERWCGQENFAHTPLDSVDAADWPIGL